jgi:hypothetical protein
VSGGEGIKTGHRFQENSPRQQFYAEKFGCLSEAVLQRRSEAFTFIRLRSPSRSGDSAENIAVPGN